MNKILFLTLKVFSATGGIEKVCRVAGKALHEMSYTADVQTSIRSMHDATQDAYENVYFPAEIFKGSSANKVNFMQAAVREGLQSDTIILSHINLLIVGWIIKKLSPKTRVYLFAHGIEIWGTQIARRRRMLKSCDGFICVSNYTRDIIVEKHGLDPTSCKVLNNCIDPFLPLPEEKAKSIKLREKYGYQKDELLLFTLTRLSSRDRYKGYDKVFEALAILKTEFPHVRYLVGGGYDAIEKAFVEKEVRRLKIEDIVTIAGYLPESELSNYFAMADIYVMPSKKEGFGIVFVEAMFYGLPVIAGNADGSTDALLHGNLGLLVDPKSVSEVQIALQKMISDVKEFTPNHKLLMSNFSYGTYKRNLQNILFGTENESRN